MKFDPVVFLVKLLVVTGIVLCLSESCQVFLNAEWVQDEFVFAGLAHYEISSDRNERLFFWGTKLEKFR